jgi:hypothetical protein
MKCYIGIYLMNLRKITKSFSQAGKCPSWDSNWAPHWPESGALPLDHSTRSCCFIDDEIFKSTSDMRVPNTMKVLNFFRSHEWQNTAIIFLIQLEIGDIKGLNANLDSPVRSITGLIELFASCIFGCTVFKFFFEHVEMVSLCRAYRLEIIAICVSPYDGLLR